MRKFLVDVNDGAEFELPPLTYEEFHTLDLFSSASDMDYDQWLRYNKFHDPDSFNDDAMANFRLELREGDAPFKVNPRTEDGEDDWQEITLPLRSKDSCWKLKSDS